MRSNTTMALAAILLGALALAGCNRQNQAQQNADQKSQTASAEAPAPDTAAGPQLPAELSAEANQKFLDANKVKSGVMTTQSGLQYRVIKAGLGKGVTAPDDIVTVTYKGSLINGKVFDQTPPGQTAMFPAGQLIPGWVEALMMMKEGDEWELVIPANLGYGTSGAGDAIPPNQTLVFDMALIKVDKQQ
jgi:FKBP-type peptidyl-prolyl cis-trans isomerase FklB